jgi:hypothetical protein
MFLDAHNLGIASTLDLFAVRGNLRTLRVLDGTLQITSKHLALLDGIALGGQNRDILNGGQVTTGGRTRGVVGITNGVTTPLDISTSKR